MKYHLFVIVFVLLNGLGTVARALPLKEVYKFMFPEATESILDGNEPQHAMYHRGIIIFTPLGQLDGLGVISKNFKGILLVELDASSCLAKAGLKKWDIITGIDGKPLSAVPPEVNKRLTPAVELSQALMRHESKGGVMSIRYERGDYGRKKRPRMAKVRIKKLGDFRSYLKTGKFVGRAQTLSSQALDELLKSQREDGSWKCGYGSQLSTSLAGVHLIMLVDRFPERKGEIFKSLKQASEYLAESHSSWEWDTGAKIWFLAEYFWATGDMSAYASLHELLKKMDIGINPLGGVCHKPLVAPYTNVNMGGPYGLVALGLKAVESCRCAYNRDTTELLMDYHVLGFQDQTKLRGYNAVGYGGNVYQGSNMGESGFRTAAYMAAWHRYRYPEKKFSADKKVIVANMHKLLQECNAAVSNIHATPAFGTIFTSLAFSTFALNTKESLENSLMKNRMEQLVLSLNSKGKFSYVYPRSARMALPGGGGWNGDSIMGLEHLSILTTISFLNSSSKNLLVNAPPKSRPFGWLTKASKKVWSEVSLFHRQQMSVIAREIKSVYKSKERKKCLGMVKEFYQTYPPEMFGKIYPPDVKKVLSLFSGKSVKAKIKTVNTQRSEVDGFLKKVYSDDSTKQARWKGFMEKVFEAEKVGKEK